MHVSSKDQLITTGETTFAEWSKDSTKAFETSKAFAKFLHTTKATWRCFSQQKKYCLVFSF
jgi:hypothetical protein